MRQAAQIKGVELEIKSISANNIDQLSKVDVVWLAPNARYEEDRVSKWCSEHKAKYGIIDPLAFSTMNGELMVDKTVEMDK